MTNKILVTDNISIEISKYNIEIFTFLPFNIHVFFEDTNVDTLDEDGKVLKTFWKFVENNKKNLFEMASFEGEVE